MNDLEKTKLLADIEKVKAETQKIHAETAKIKKETKYYPATTYYGVVAGAIGAIGLYLFQHFIK